MKSVSTQFNPILRELKRAEQEKDLCRLREQVLKAHAFISDPRVYGGIENYQYECLQKLDDESVILFRSSKYQGNRTIAFFLYHMTRIEDICANVFVADQEQVVFREPWKEIFAHHPIDTGNSWTTQQISDFSTQINLRDLLDYRRAVGESTRVILSQITMNQLKEKPTAEQCQRLLENKSIADHEASRWLLDFWKKKNGLGLILMPLTRHQVVHLSDCLAILKKVK